MIPSLCHKMLAFRVLFYLLIIPCFTPISMAQQAQRNFVPFKFALTETVSPMSEQDLVIEVAKVKEAQEKFADYTSEINYWNAAYPSYRWHQVMMQVSGEHSGHKNGGRVVILHLAVYDALVEVWKQKKMHNQEPPYLVDEQIQQLGRHYDYSSFICEWSAAAGAAHRIIGHYFPDRRSTLDSLLRVFVDSRLATGLQYPSDIERGMEIGVYIAEQYIEYAGSDRTDQIWQGQVPESDSLWSGDPGPWDPMKRQWKPLTLETADQFRPEPPPTDWTSDMEELREFNRVHQSSDIAWKWKSVPVWDNLVERKILEYDLDPFAAAYVNAVFHTARFDAIIAAWDGKYHYWGIRPFQYDPEFKPILIDTPNFPGYPAGHTTVAGSIATALSYFFPRDRETFHQLAWECSESRFEGGVHFRTDNEVGIEVGNQVGSQVIQAFSGAR